VTAWSAGGPLPAKPPNERPCKAGRNKTALGAADGRHQCAHPARDLDPAPSPDSTTADTKTPQTTEHHHRARDVTGPTTKGASRCRAPPFLTSHSERSKQPCHRPHRGPPDQEATENREYVYTKQACLMTCNPVTLHTAKALSVVARVRKDLLRKPVRDLQHHVSQQPPRQARRRPGSTPSSIKVTTGYLRMDHDVSARFVRLLRTGRNPESAWLLATRGDRDASAPPSTLGRLRCTEKEEALLTSSRQRWAALGLTPPWEAGGIPDGPPARPSESKTAEEVPPTESSEPSRQRGQRNCKCDSGGWYPGAVLLDERP
jgi:hypothetical protein